MYPVSSDYIDILKSIGEKERRIRGTVDAVSFNENDILDGSFSYTDIAVKSAEIKLGGVFIGELSLTVLQGHLSTISRGTWEGRIINCHVDTLLGYDENEQPVWEAVPLKPYKIVQAQHSALGLDIKAEDAMYDFDKPIIMNVTAGKIYGMLTLACTECNVELGMTEEEVEALPNGGQILGLHPDNDIETWRDLISWIAVVVGGFATINREGKLVVRTWHLEPDLTIGINDRFKGGSWSDFATNYTAITVKNIEDGSDSYYSVSPDNGLTMDIGAHPLLQYGVETVKTEQRMAILTALQNLKYYPFTSSSLLDPALDLGDVVLYEGGIANGSLCCVMRIDFSFRKGATVKGYGKNPAMNGAKSKQDKAISAMSGSQKEQGLTYYTFVNTEAVELTTTAKKLYSIAFAVNETTTVTLWNEIKSLNELVDDTQSITYEYYLDGVKFDYEPIDTFGEDGYHTEPHPYWLQNVEAGRVHTWLVKAKLDSGTATVAIGDLHALIYGQKMAAQAGFDGNIECYDEMTPIVLHRAIATFLENVSVATQRPIITSISETMSVMKLRRRIVALTDEATLTGRLVEYTRTTEDGGTRYTEEGNKRITE